MLFWHEAMTGPMRPMLGAPPILRLSGLPLRLLKPDLALALTWWTINCTSAHKKVAGNTTMNLQKFDDGWKIVPSHTSISAPRMVRGQNARTPAASLIRNQAGANREPHQSRYVVDLQSVHQLQAMRFDRFHADGKVTGNFFCVLTFRYPVQYLSLPQRQLSNFGVGPLRLFLRPSNIGHFHPLPNALADGHGKLMQARGIENLPSPAQGERKCAGRDYPLILQHLIDLLFELTKFLWAQMISDPRRTPD